MSGSRFVKLKKALSPDQNYKDERFSDNRNKVLYDMVNLILCGKIDAFLQALNIKAYWFALLAV